MDCLITYKGHRFNSEKVLEQYFEAKFDGNIYESMPANELRIQLDVEKDVEVQNKKLATQVVNIIGVMQSENNAFKQLHTAISLLIDKFVRSMLGGNDGSTKGLIRMLRNEEKKRGLTESLHAQKFANDGGIGIGLLRSKLLPILINKLNKRVMPDMPGNTYAQGTIDADIYEYDDGTITVGYLNQEKTLLRKRSLNPMYITYDGKIIEPEIRDGRLVEPMEIYYELMSNEETRSKVGISAEEVMMPYPYRRHFNLPSDTNLEESRNYIKTNSPELLDEFEKSLEVVLFRIPMSNGSLGGRAKIVEFVEDSGNTIFIPEKKNIFDGSDQDIDMLHVFFYPLEDKVKTKSGDMLDDLSKDSIETDNISTNSNGKEYGYEKDDTLLRKNIYNSLVSFYNNADNVPLIMNPINMNMLKEEADKVSVEEEKNGNRKWISMPDNDLEMHRQNQDGKVVGYFANMNTFFARLLSIKNSTEVEHNPTIKIFEASNAVSSSIIDFTNILVNSATDNAKFNYNGRLNINDETSAVIAGMVAMGFIDGTMESKRTLIRILRSKSMLEAVNSVNKTITILSDKPNTFKKRLSDYFLGKVSIDDVKDKVNFYNNKIDMTVKDRYGLPKFVSNETHFMSAAFEVTKLLRENGDIQEDDYNELNRIVDVFFTEAALIGDKIVEYGMATSITKEIPNGIDSINEYISRFEKYVGMTMDDYLNGVEKSVDEKVSFVLNVEKNKRNISEEELNRMAYVLKKNFTYEQSFNDDTLLRNHPNMMSALNAIRNLKANVLPEMSFGQVALNNGFKDKLKKNSRDAYDRFTEATDNYIIGKYLTNEVGKRMMFNGEVYDMRSASGRMQFVDSFYEFVSQLINNPDYGFIQSELVNKLVLDTTYDTGQPVVRLNVDYNEDPVVIAEMENDINKIDSRYSNFKEALALYNLIVYGIKTSKGYMLDFVIDTNIYKGLGSYIESVNEDVAGGRMKINEDELIRNVAIQHPDLVLNRYSKSSKMADGLTYENISWKSGYKGGRNSSMYRLRENGRLVSPIIGKEINIFGANGLLLVDSYSQVQLDHKQHKELVEQGRVMVNGTKSFIAPFSSLKTETGGQFNGYTFYGEPVMVKYVNVSGKDNAYRQYEVRLIKEMNDTVNDEVKQLKDENDIVSCKTL
jgi:hypothetical protein